MNNELFFNIYFFVGIQNVDWSAVPPDPNANALNPTGELPARNEWPGQHLFDVKLDVTDTTKKHCVVRPKPLQMQLTYFISML